MYIIMSLLSLIYKLYYPPDLSLQNLQKKCMCIDFPVSGYSPLQCQDVAFIATIP